MRWLRWVIVATILGAATLVAAGAGGDEPARTWAVPQVSATGQTPGAHGDGDVADDPAIWVHPRDPSLSLVIGTNKGDPGGLQVLDLDGDERQHLVADGPLNNVDLRAGFPFPEGPGTLVAATNRAEGTVELFKVDPVSRMLFPLGSRHTGLEDVYGFCLYRSAVSGRFYAVVTSEDGAVRQFELSPGVLGIGMGEVRRWELSSEGEGCVADDERGHLYLTQETRGLWKLAAEPAEPPILELLDEAGDRPPLVADIEGVTIYDAGGGEGYLVVSSQGSSTFAVYERSVPHRYLGSFAVVDGPVVDGATVTDGLDVTSATLDERFPAGLLVVHDQHNRGSDTSNFKYVSWADVAAALRLDLVHDVGSRR